MAVLLRGNETDRLVLHHGNSAGFLAHTANTRRSPNTARAVSSIGQTTAVRSNVAHCPLMAGRLLSHAIGICRPTFTVGSLARRGAAFEVQREFENWRPPARSRLERPRSPSHSIARPLHGLQLPYALIASKP